VREDGQAFAAERAGEVVGYCWVRLHEAPPLPIFAPRRFAEIDTLVVVAPHRRHGVGRALVERAHRWAIERGADEVRLVVWEFNRDALRFYESLDYATSRRTMSRGLDDGGFAALRGGSAGERGHRWMDDSSGTAHSRAERLTRRRRRAAAFDLRPHRVPFLGRPIPPGLDSSEPAGKPFVAPDQGPEPRVRRPKAPRRWAHPSTDLTRHSSKPPLRPLAPVHDAGVVDPLGGGRLPG